MLTKAKSRDDAKDNVESFLEPYGEGNVWDWYVIGGRWSGTLNEKNREFEKKVKELCPPEQKFGYSVREMKEKRESFNELWKKIGGKGLNPYSRDSYMSDGYEDDIMLASKCKSVLKEWEQDMKEIAEKHWKNTLKERRKEKADTREFPMSGYHANRYAECVNDSFCFENNVYDTEEDTHKLPKTLKGYYAVMVDMHN